MTRKLPCIGYRWAAPALLLLAGSSTTACGASAVQQREELRKQSSAAELQRRGEVCARLGDLTRAEQYLIAALKAGGDEKQLTERLLVVCVADQRYPAAVEYAEQYLHRHPDDDDIKFATATLHVALGDMERARKLLEQVLRSRPDWPEAHYALASVLREQGEARELADVHDLAYLKQRPQGALSAAARARIAERMP
jgi:tetratricopeptide (TPR) repeat protein